MCNFEKRAFGEHLCRESVVQYELVLFWYWWLLRSIETDCAILVEGIIRNISVNVFGPEVKNMSLKDVYLSCGDHLQLLVKFGRGAFDPKNFTKTFIMMPSI